MALGERTNTLCFIANFLPAKLINLRFEEQNETSSKEAEDEENIGFFLKGPWKRRGLVIVNPNLVAICGGGGDGGGSSGGGGGSEVEVG